MNLNECINFQLNNVQGAVFNFFKGKLTPYNVTPIQYALLKCLWTEDMQQPTQLAQAIQIDTSSVTGLLDRLEKKGLLERIYNSPDRRRLYVHILPDGAALQEPVEAAISEANQEILAGIEPGDLENFRRQLKIIEQNATTKLTKK